MTKYANSSTEETRCYDVVIIYSGYVFQKQMNASKEQMIVTMMLLVSMNDPDPIVVLVKKVLMEQGWNAQVNNCHSDMKHFCNLSVAHPLNQNVIHDQTG